MRKIFAFIALALLAGCAGGGSKYQPNSVAKNSGKSELVIVRADHIFESGRCFIIRVDGQDMGKLKNAGFLRYWVEPGEHKISYKWGDHDVEVFTWHAKEGDSAYMAFEPLGLDRHTLRRMREPEAQKALEEVTDSQSASCGFPMNVA